MTMWMVRSGREGRWSDDFISGSFVGLGWHQAGDSTPHHSKKSVFEAVQQAYPDMTAQDPFEGVADESYLRIADRISSLDWQEMQSLVAALLRAMGYRTEISPVGPDRGKDIIASPDGFGFEQPRIVVEVKHRTGEKIDAPGIRSFVGGRHVNDRGLFVSTGGFTREAYYEAERSNIPLKLLTLEDLARAVVEHYDRFDSRGRALLPLTRMFWPA